MNIDSSIFKAYDIRGLYPEQLHDEVGYALGRAYATLLQKENPGKKLTIGVGSDMRVSSPALKRQVIAALADSGVNVADIGLVSTPTFYFAIAFNGYDGGLQISASHNPKQWNGFKMVRAAAVPISGETGILELRRMVEQDDFMQLAAESDKGMVSEVADSVEVEADTELKDFDLASIKPFHIAVDGSNAMAAVDAVTLFERIPQCALVKINMELDGTFPAHDPDPMVEANTAQLRQLVVSEHCDIGIAPDGDGDRYFFVDEKGEMIPQAILRGLMAEIELKEHPGATVAYDIRPGRITRDIIEANNGKAIVTRVGHSLIKEAMIREGAIFGGESSGHYFYKLPFGVFETPMILVAKLLRFLSAQNKPVSEVVAPYKKYFNTGEINIHLPDRDAVNKKIEEVKAKYTDGAQNLLDGVSIEYPDYWFNVRASNTEPLLRLTIEARTKEIMEQKQRELTDFVSV